MPESFLEACRNDLRIPRHIGQIQVRLAVSVAILSFSMHSVDMPYRPKKKKPQVKTGEAGNQSRDYQFLDQRHRDFTTRNTLARLRNRKSDIK
jgi:hypothetical protein